RTRRRCRGRLASYKIPNAGGTRPARRLGTRVTRLAAIGAVDRAVAASTRDAAGRTRQARRSDQNLRSAREGPTTHGDRLPHALRLVLGLGSSSRLREGANRVLQANARTGDE